MNETPTHNNFYGTQLTTMSNAYISILTFNKIVDRRDFIRFTDDVSDQLKGRKLIQFCDDDKRQIIVIFFDPTLKTSFIDNKLRQIIGSCSPNLRVSF